MTLTGKGEIRAKSLFQYHFIHHKSHEPLPSREKHKHANTLLNIYYLYIYIFSPLWRCDPNAGHCLLILEVSRSHTTTHHSR